MHLHWPTASRKHLKTWQLVLLLAMLSSVTVGGVMWHIAQVRAHLLERSARTYAELYSLALTELRTVYTQDVVETAVRHGLMATHDYANRTDAIPLPATLTIELGQTISKRTHGSKVQLYSPHPFPWRQQQHRWGAFENDAWAALSQNPDEPFYRVETIDGQQVMRYASADVMRPACVGCHNRHPDSPKRDWQVGDLRGVLEVSLPMDESALGVRRGLRSTMWLLLAIAATAVLGITLALTQLRVRAELHEHLSRTDALTGLYNRRAFDEALARECGHARRHHIPLSLLLIDVDHFKIYNDHYGHPAGDTCLKRVALTVRKQVRRPADIAARYGGEEFVAVLPTTDGIGARQAAEAIRAHIEALGLPQAPAATHRSVTVSIGVASLSASIDSPDTLLEAADTALYQAKKNGRNQVSTATHVS